MKPCAASLILPAEIDHLHEAQRFVRHQAERMGVPEKFCSTLELVIEELFVNIVDHGRPAVNTDVEVQCVLEECSDNSMAIFALSIRDWGAPFNPLERDAPALGVDIEERSIGGLGIYLISKMAGRCTYVRDGESNLFQTFLEIPKS